MSGDLRHRTALTILAVGFALGSLGMLPAGSAQATVLRQGGGDPLGTTWTSEYRSGGGGRWTDTWTRRGNSNVFDVVLQDGTSRTNYVHEVTLQGNRVTVRRTAGPYSYCRYEGTLTGTTITGTMICEETYTWRATIAGVAAASPPSSAAAAPPRTAPSGRANLDTYCRNYMVDLSAYGLNLQVWPFDGATQYQGAWYCYANYGGIDLWVSIGQ